MTERNKKNGRLRAGNSGADDPRPGTPAYEAAKERQRARLVQASSFLREAGLTDDDIRRRINSWLETCEDVDRLGDAYDEGGAPSTASILLNYN